MTFALQILIVSFVFYLIILLVLIQKKRPLKSLILKRGLLVFSLLFISISVFYFYIEFSSYKKREKRYTVGDIQFLNTDDSTTSTELNTLENYQDYLNSLRGYAHFLVELAHESSQSHISYLYILNILM